ncbi:DUF6283 family protein [Streptomyces sp. NBC_01077]|uniref:DUF6283 family protein n=1 Tax=Streptomyces sp. NBC_01077 TaxID=2903746 RepID=UPI00386A465D
MCPCRRDVPAGIWAREEYAKLRRYDADAPSRSNGAESATMPRNVCRAWSGCGMLSAG